MADRKFDDKTVKGKISMTYKLNTRQKMVLMIVVNTLFVIALVTCLLVYSAQNDKDTFNQNQVNIQNVAIAKADLAQSIVFTANSNMKNVYYYCNGKTESEALAYLSTIKGSDGDDEYQLLELTAHSAVETVYEGKSTAINPQTGNPTTVKYTNSSHVDFVETLYAYTISNAKGQIKYATEFSNRTNGIKSYSPYCGVTLKDDVTGTDVSYIVLKPQSKASLLEEMDTESTQYPDMTFAICDSDGYYLASQSSFRSVNFYEYLYTFNKWSLDQMNEIRDGVNNNVDGVGTLYYSDSKGNECSFAYARFADTPDWYAVICVPHIDFEAEALIPTLPLIIILILAALLVFNMLELVQIIRRLRVAIINERYANQAKSDFLSRMSHDMRTPLNSIINFSDFIGNTATLPEAKEYGEKVNRSGRYLLTLINDTLSMSRIEAGHMFLKPEPMKFQDFEQGLLSILGDKASQKGVEFKINVQNSKDATIMLDPLRLQQVFINLLNNAIKFTPTGGIVELNICADDMKDGVLTLRFEVKDTGRGMSKEFLENKLFKPFSQEHSGQDTEESGTGLGLSIAKSIVEEMDGTITCQSEVGEGTTFTVIIPAKVVKIGENMVASPDGQKSDEYPDNKEFSLDGRRVLVCEDNDLNREIVAHLLKKVGCLAEAAENGEIGLQLFEKSAEGFYDAVLMDKRMPVMDGLEATKKIRALGRQDAKEIPIIALSADVFDEHIESGMRSGMTSYLPKPIEPQLLYKELRYRISERVEKQVKGSKAD